MKKFIQSKIVFTVEFVEIIDNLFDSMNGATENVTDNKAYKCGISNTPPHLLLWENYPIIFSNGNYVERNIIKKPLDTHGHTSQKLFLFQTVGFRI